MTTILAIDPGTESSAIVAWNGESVGLCEYVANEELLCHLRWDAVVCELIQSFGMPVGKEVFETAYLIGRIQEIAGDLFHGVYRSDVKLHLCQSARAKDPHVRQALLDKFGGKQAVGRKNSRLATREDRSTACLAIAGKLSRWL